MAEPVEATPLEVSTGSTSAGSTSGGSTSAARVMARADELATHSSRADGIERVYLSPEHRAVNHLAASWMHEAGLVAWEDAAGNQCGRRAGATDELPAVLLGSHLDTVPGAGRYDGILGVLVAIEVAARLRDTELPFALEVVAFGDEEGTRFGTTLLGSRALAGTWQPEWFDLVDASGIRLGDAAIATNPFELFLDYGLRMSFEQYVLVGSSVRSYLAWLKDSGRMDVIFENGQMLWKAVV